MEMEYRQLGNTGFSVSAVGVGGEHLCTRDYPTVETTVGAAVERGVNIFDLFMPEVEYRRKMGDALRPYRKNVYLQGHIGAVLQGGQYARSRKVKEADTYVRDFLEKYHTDYIDLGMVHFVDTQKDWDGVFESDFIDYALRLKEKGVIRKLGVSCHMPATAIKLVETGIFDLLLFSINPAYDFEPAEKTLDQLIAAAPTQGQLSPERERLYQLCGARGVGITVMKALAAGKLLDPATTPFHRPLTVTQCIHYALSKPGVASVLLGVQSVAELEDALGYFDASEEERDFSFLAQEMQGSLSHRCMYCNHCLPCPQHIDVAAVHKYLDLAEAGEGLSVPATVAAHYEALPVTAGECIACGSCEKNCPFGVPVIENMARATRLFGK
ncbi:aldo/keto reductase [Bittarella massiliensis (ex Durand et al. 2017)]|uniref:aldo/keto reductase n=1 Tax=Bittarella massiliensis (ex Durand et al. 2017) TaxID=1720313 RepID=UPI0009EA465C|nr:aldo/keto reductase [Bittarella massiliensis (ex Durand et al. 2017)]